MPRAPLTPEQRALRARTAAYASHVDHDPRDRTRAASAATPTQLPYWERKVREESPGLNDAEVTRRASLRHRQHMTSMALKSSRARQARCAKPDAAA